MIKNETLEQASTDLRGLITRGEYHDARRLLERYSKGAPLPFTLRLLECDLFARTDQAEEAEARLRALHTERPDSLAPTVRLIRLLLQENRIDEARAIFIETMWETPVQPVDATPMVNQLTSGTVDTTATILFLRRLLATQPGHAVALLRLGVMLAREEKSEEALEALDKSAAQQPLPAYCMLLRIDMLIAVGRYEEAIAQARELVAIDPSHPRYAEKLVVSAAAARNPALVAQALADAVVACPQDWMLLFRFTRLPLSAPHVQKLFALIAERAPSPGADGRRWFHYAMACLEQGKVDTSLDALRYVEPESSAHHMARPLQAALLKLKQDGLQAGRIAEDRLRDFDVVEVPGSTTLLIVFAGLMGRFSYLPLSLLDGYLSRYRLHVVYLRDVRSSAYLEGLPALGANEAESQEALKALAERLGATRVITFGTSIGGFAAMRYGARMGATAAVSLAGPSSLNLQTDIGSGEVGGRIGKAMAMVAHHVDLLTDLEQAPDMLKIYGYNALTPRHLAQMQRHSSVPNTVLRPVPNTADHFCALHSVATGLLDTILEQDLGIPRL